MFQPKFIKQGRLLQKGVRKFLHYKRDVIPAAAMENIETQAGAFDAALKARDKEAVKTEADKLTKVCQKSVPEYRNSGLRENLEVIFVAIVIAVGIRAYILQPFKIPTGSMQPTLNGIIGYDMSESPNYDPPGIAGRVWDKLVRGRTYLNAVAEEDGWLVEVRESTHLRFFTHTDLQFKDPDKDMRVNASAKVVMELMGLEIAKQFDVVEKDKHYIAKAPGGVPVEAGTPLVVGYVDTGDQVLVDKMSYHFRHPRRGEVFVFTTRGITGIPVEDARQGSQHYIKRLVGVPGDTLHIEPTPGAVRVPYSHPQVPAQLFINGEPASEEGMRRVMEDPDYAPGYTWPLAGPIAMPGGTITLEATPGRKEYFAMGDHSDSSFDSRNWGPVPEMNVVGPALIVYWPFVPHWGFID